MNLLILVVDDEPDVELLFRQQFRHDLRAGRFTMEFAQSAPAALQRISDAADVSLILILSDINMPGMSGLELLPKAKAARPDVPVIMITAYGDAETKRKALENGADALFTKPIDFVTLRSEIETRVRTRRMTARILVVDDEPDLETLVLQKFRHQIRDGAVSFLFARDGVEALAALKANGGIDLVVTDINMPRMDGLSLLQRLQEGEEKVSTIIVSAYGDMINIRTAMNRGAFDFVTKPIDFADLETTIAKTLRHIEILRQARQRQATAERAYASLSRYFSPNLAQRLASDTDAIDLGGQRREIATLFTDIESFTALVETLEPSVLGPLLNEYLTGMTDIVFAHDGTVAKIVGDALHVLFGAPGEQPDQAHRAVACALALDAYAETFRDQCSQKGVGLGLTRIGVHAGPAIVGNFGGERFFDYTAYGDTINVAATA